MTERYILSVQPAEIETLVATDRPEPGSPADAWRAAAAKAERRVVDAWRLGPFAVHESVSTPGWTVTHIATGFAVRSEIGSRRLALGIAAELLVVLPDAWDFTDVGVTKEWPGPQKALVQKAGW